MNTNYRIIFLLVLIACFGAPCMAGAVQAQDAPDVLPATGAPAPARANDYITYLDALRAGGQSEAASHIASSPVAFKADRILREYEAAASADMGTANGYITTLDYLRALGAQ